MNIERIFHIGRSPIFMGSYKNDMSSVPSKTMYSKYYGKKNKYFSINQIITGTVIGGIVGALFSNNKSFINIVLSSLRGAGIALLGIVTLGCITNFINLDSYK